MRGATRAGMLALIAFPYSLLCAGSRPEKPDTLSCAFPGSDSEAGYIDLPACLVLADTALSILPRAAGKLKYDRRGIAWIGSKEHGWVMVGKRRGVLQWGIATMDNSHDEFNSGLVRVNRNGKWGYADRSGRLKIPLAYDGAFPFENGAAKVCVGCAETPDGEYHTFKGGDWFTLDSKGNRKPIKAA